jgi:hypothetical protein
VALSGSIVWYLDGVNDLRLEALPNVADANWRIVDR